MRTVRVTSAGEKKAMVRDYTFPTKAEALKFIAGQNVVSINKLPGNIYSITTSNERK